MEAKRHHRTWSYGVALSDYPTVTDINGVRPLTPRELLFRDIQDIRRIYKEEGLYGPYIRKKLRELIEQNMMRWLGFFDK